MSTYYQNGKSVNDGIELMISILVRYPEINTIKTDPKAGELIFSFLMKKELTQLEFFTLQKELKKNIETFLFIENKQPNTIRFELQSYEGYSFIEVIRDYQTISQREISLLIHLLHSEWGTYLLTEQNEETGELEEIEMQEELIEDLLDRLQFENHDDLIGYREAGKVMVFQKTA